MKKIDIIGSIIMSSLDTCTRMTKASKEDEVNRILTLIEKIEDNPVPSIDNLKIDFDKEENSELWSYDSNTHLENFIAFINKLQNGVETD